MDAQKKLSLAARYRPQTFAQVAGQEMVKAVLSRACLEDRPACAYLFSGTRGVGKTTIARIFAKALNCAKAPCAEPCNNCIQCQRIMQGGHVDVVEIDGASNNKVEDVRALRETVGYSPMEGRYKIFIIDEAHMLTTPAFNALLKTLEEPPPHVVFMMATTEVHKFPVTIISRCQHFTFRHLNEDEIAAHLRQVLHAEDLPFEEEAIRLIAKRAQGSVRDSMSLLDQTLALGDSTLTIAVTREVLGLAGQEFFEELFLALSECNTVKVIELARTILRRGVDIAFLIAELANNLRNLFLTAQAGSAILQVLQLSPDEAKFVQTFANKFSQAHLHSAWQLVLEAQKSVVQSTEPASALELLLLNLTLLPKLLPLDNLALRMQQQAQGSSQTPEPKRPQYQNAPRSGTFQAAQISQPPPSPTPTVAPEPVKPISQQQAQQAPVVAKPKPSQPELQVANKSGEQEATLPKTFDQPKTKPPDLTFTPSNDVLSSNDEDDDDVLAQPVEQLFHHDKVIDSHEFSAFYASFKAKNPACTIMAGELVTSQFKQHGSKIELIPSNEFIFKRFKHDEAMLVQALQDFLQRSDLTLEIAEPKAPAPKEDLTKIVQEKEALQAYFEILDAKVEFCRKL